VAAALHCCTLDTGAIPHTAILLHPSICCQQKLTEAGAALDLSAGSLCQPLSLVYVGRRCSMLSVPTSLLLPCLRSLPLLQVSTTPSLFQHLLDPRHPPSPALLQPPTLTLRSLMLSEVCARWECALLGENVVPVCGITVVHLHSCLVGACCCLCGCAAASMDDMPSCKA